MAKSTRSKVKRSYRAKKRDEGVYAAIEAARLARLSAKLKAVASLPAEDEEEGEEAREDGEGDEVMEDADAEGAEGEKTEGKGRCRDSNVWGGSDDGFDFAAFGLLGLQDITLEGMEAFCADDRISAQKTTSIILKVMGSDSSSFSMPTTAVGPGGHASNARPRQCRRMKSSRETKSCH